ncbi:MAG: carboxypeptidase regulatory-like domain-containing protein [Terracidiphilus sp.]
MRCRVAVGIVVACALSAWGQSAPAPQTSPAAAAGQAAYPAVPQAARVAAPAQANSAVAGGRLHGVVRSGKIPLPGVTVTAENTLTGKRYSTTTDINGAWSMTIPDDGRYVIRTSFAAFAPASGEALLNAAGRDRTVDLSLILASRAAEQEEQQARAGGASGQGRGGQNGAGQDEAEQAIQLMDSSGSESLSLMNTDTGGADTGVGAAGTSGAALPSIATNSGFSDDSVAVSGNSGQVSPMAGVDIDALRQRMQERGQAGGQPGGQQIGGLFGGGGGFGGGGFGGGGFGRGGFGGRGGGGGGGRNFRGFNPGQPHGAVFWEGTNSAVNAIPFSLRGQTQVEPANGTNRFGLTFMSAPYIPGLTKPSGKDTVFLSLSGRRGSTPKDFYATVPTIAERGGDFSASGLAPIYDPATNHQFNYQGTPNVIPPNLIATQATALMNYYPAPNLTGASVVDNYNYHLLTTAQSNGTQFGARYNRSLGPNASQPGGRFGGFGGGRRGRSANQGLRQSANGNFNMSHSASDQVNLFPQLGGKESSNSYSLRAGYTVGYHKITSISNVGWNRSAGQTTNFFTNTSDNVAADAGIAIPNNVALNYGLPDISLSGLQGLSQTQPSFSVNQTISVSEVLSYRTGKHNMRFGGDYRRVQHNFLAGSNPTGNFTFTGWFTQQTVTPASGTPEKNAATGSSVADFLLGYPDETSINSSLTKAYLRDNASDAYALDDWRPLANLTLSYGVRYEFYAPYTEKYGRLADVSTNPDQGFTSETEVESGAPGLPGSLVYPYYHAFAPRIGLAWRVPKIKQTVVRAGFGMNYTIGEYATFASLMAHQPPFTNEQTNNEVDLSGNVVGACDLTTPPTCFTAGLPAPDTVGNYAVDPHYGMPYVQVWNLDVQKTLPWAVVLNLGYNGVKSNHQDITSAPRAIPGSRGTDPTGLVFTYDQAEAFSKLEQGTVRVFKRLTGGVSMSAYYQFSHSIDDAGALGGVNGAGAQDWQNLAAEEGNTLSVPRHKVTGNYLYELPFGQDKHWATTGVPSHILEGFSVSGSFIFASGTFLSPGFEPSTQSVNCGITGAVRPNLVPGVSISGPQNLQEWFNTAAFQAPSNTVTPTASYCDFFGNAPRGSIVGPGTVSNNMALSKTMQLGDTRSMEFRATMDNVFNTVQYSGVDTTLQSPTFGQVTSVGQMRTFQFTARFRF